MIHKDRHPLAGQTVMIKSGEMESQEYRIEDWADRVMGNSWIFMAGNPTCLQYAIRGVHDSLPTDDNVLYGKIGGLGYLVHVQEIDAITPTTPTTETPQDDDTQN